MTDQEDIQEKIKNVMFGKPKKKKEEKEETEESEK